MPRRSTSKHAHFRPPPLVAIRGVGVVHSRAFPSCCQGFEFLYIVVDKFTKWTEVELVRKVIAESAIKFVRGLVCHFGVPNHIIIDNGTKFTSNVFTSYYEELGT